MTSHLYSAYNLNKTYTLSRAIRKYKIEKLDYDIIFSDESESKIDEMEKHYIKLYDSTNIIYGYNIASGGEGGDTISNNINKESIFKKQMDSKGLPYTEISEDMWKTIISEYESGGFIKTIAKKYKLDSKRIKRMFNKRGIIVDKDRQYGIFIPTEEINEKIRTMFLDKKTIKDIAAELNLTIMIVSRILNDTGIRESKRFKNGKRYDGRQPKRLQDSI
jgi:hypothetical protein